MADITDADRAAAAQVVSDANETPHPWLEECIAQALADQREALTGHTGQVRLNTLPPGEYLIVDSESGTLTSAHHSVAVRVADVPEDLLEAAYGSDGDARFVAQTYGQVLSISPPEPSN